MTGGAGRLPFRPAKTDCRSGGEAARLVVVIDARVAEDLIAESAAALVDGWGFEWLAGRATEERPPWGYSRLVADRMSRADAALGVDTGGGEVLAEVPRPPHVLVATEAWPPNVLVARRNLRPLGATVVAVAPDSAMPLLSEAILGPLPPPDSRHPEEAVASAEAAGLRVVELLCPHPHPSSPPQLHDRRGAGPPGRRGVGAPGCRAAGTPGCRGVGVSG
ncbi:hypothetical protein ACLQ24_08465 [Micromonospora sp. DT4]|uniref:hypothetical protein n=1 Tax=Micromonospora sp. DT4 TaxID=3393438 RepID=UPI003CEA75E8